MYNHPEVEALFQRQWRSFLLTSRENGLEESRLKAGSQWESCCNVSKRWPGFDNDSRVGRKWALWWDTKGRNDKICWLVNVRGRAEGEGRAKDNALVFGLGNQVAGCAPYESEESNLAGKQYNKRNAALNILSLSCPQSIQAEVSSSQLDLKYKKDTAWQYRFGSYWCVHGPSLEECADQRFSISEVLQPPSGVILEMGTGTF